MPADDLSDYGFDAELETSRFHTTEPVQDERDKRSPFERDRARIIHSVAFRHLQGKTQIFASGWTDFLRTRVTHSIEVAQIGRGLALRFGVPESLVEAACLGHDLGHPPFGHTGEHALETCMAPHGGFEGNAQTFRIVTRLEEKSVDYEGLDLTRATLLGLIKYPFEAAPGRKKYVYSDDAATYREWLYEGSGTSLVGRGEERQLPPRTIVCDMMDWADDVAYSVHDLEDGLAAGILRPELWTQDDFVDSIWRNTTAADIRWQQGPPSRNDVEAVLKDASGKFREIEPVIHKDVIREVARYYIDRFTNAAELRVADDARTFFDYRLEVPEGIRLENQVLKAITFEYVIYDHRTTTFVHKGYEIVRRLWQTLFENTQDPKTRYELFPREMRSELESLAGDQSASARRVCDYVASMTEGQAVQLYGRLFESSSGSPFLLA
jgi:dGTPase